MYFISLEIIKYYTQFFIAILGVALEPTLIVMHVNCTVYVVKKTSSIFRVPHQILVI